VTKKGSTFWSKYNVNIFYAGIYDLNPCTTKVMADNSYASYHSDPHHHPVISLLYRTLSPSPKWEKTRWADKTITGANT
jgi:hypothetical protein